MGDAPYLRTRTKDKRTGLELRLIGVAPARLI